MSKTKLLQKVSAACAVLLAVWMLLMPAGCASPGEADTQKPYQPEVVYDDGVYRVACTGMTVTDTGNGTAEMCLDLLVTNNSVSSMAISSVLGVRVTADGQPSELLTVPAEQTPLDGLLDAGTGRQGTVVARVPVEAKSFTVEISADYLNDIWITFDITQ